MGAVSRLSSLTEDYIHTTEELIAHRQPTDGLFGMRDPAKDSPCHEEYFSSIGEAVQELAASAPSPEEAEAAVRFLLRADTDYPCPELARLTLTAVQQHALPLIPFLSASVRAELAAWYRKACPRLRRLPVQNTVLRALQQISAD